jgi:uncharacterized protein (DUF486 family)
VNPVLQTVLPLSASNVVMTFAIPCMKQGLKLDYLWAALCLLVAVCFVFRGE